MPVYSIRISYSIHEATCTLYIVCTYIFASLTCTVRSKYMYMYM